MLINQIFKITQTHNKLNETFEKKPARPCNICNHILSNNSVEQIRRVFEDNLGIIFIISP